MSTIDIQGRISMPEATGNASADAALTEEETAGSGQDLTEVVRGLTRRNNQLKEELARAAAAPKPEVQEELESLRKFKTKAETLEKYSDVADTLKNLFKNKDFDTSIIDDDFVAAIREARGTTSARSEEETEEPVTPINPVRRGGVLTQEQKDEQVLKGLASIFDIT